jgi:hypothetical protein
MRTTPTIRVARTMARYELLARERMAMARVAKRERPEAVRTLVGMARTYTRWRVQLAREAAAGAGEGAR